MSKFFRSVREVRAVQWQTGAKHRFVRELAEPWSFGLDGGPDPRGPIIAILFRPAMIGGDFVPIRRWDWIVSERGTPDRPYRMSNEDFVREFAPGQQKDASASNQQSDS